VKTDRVVVIDDPVSSLDSEVLFIVSTLIRDIFGEVRREEGHLKQIFVLTHNVYFHKELTHHPRRPIPPKDETFWVVRKLDGCSKVKGFDENPVKSSYDLLWAEVRNPNRSKLTIQNTLRRILEHYFKILGGVKFDDIYKKFEGSDKLICKSLISWIHDGSHSVQDDLSITIEDDAALEANLRVFKEIFQKSQHGAHYEMMMNGSV
jgi:wobble nucleotide-excising tRNase